MEMLFLRIVQDCGMAQKKSETERMQEHRL